MKLTIQLTEQVTLSRTHIVELESTQFGEQYPELKDRMNLSLYIQKNIFNIKDRDGKTMLDNVIQTPGLEEVEDIQYEVEVESKD